MKDSVKFGVIGCGLMGREFASAAARFLHLSSEIKRPEIIAVCDVNPANSKWFSDNIPSVAHVCRDYRELLAIEEIEAVYVAVPHNLHEEVYRAVIESGRHLMGEKPFGIDRAANARIVAAAKAHPELVVRCASEYPFYPAMRLIVKWFEEGRFGRPLEVKAGFNHSSDMNPDKPINWKRQKKFCGEYGCLGDLGIHTQHVPFRLGLLPERVYGVFSNFIETRPDGRGGATPCDTWDNATLVIDARDRSGNGFPMYLETKRMAPGCTDDWYFEIYGDKCSAKFSSTRPNVFSYTSNWGAEQGWCDIQLGYKPMLPAITGGIFEFGFTDAILQMWGAYMAELSGVPVEFSCFTPEETALSHALCTSALRSVETRAAVEVAP